MAGELLLELFSEEIPAGMQARASADLAAAVTAALAEAGLSHGATTSYVTPRRLTLVVPGLPARQADREAEKRGPRTDAPQAARDGFIKSLGNASYRLEEREEKKGRVVYALLAESGRATAEVLAGALPEILARFPWPKSMRWGSGDARWVRPLQSILCLFDGKVVPFTFAGIESGDRTRGHRFLAPEPFAVRDFADYAAKLATAKVVLAPVDRRRLIEDGASRLAAAQGLRIRDDQGLVDELVGLVEWSVPLMGRIDDGFMSLPPEVLQTSMKTHQRYLALEDGEGRLAPRFVTVANIAAEDGGAAIIAGNERVLRARLWDARYFWEQDQKQPLESRLPALGRMVFHAQLGSLEDRVQRLVALAGALVPYVPGADRVLAERAALLAKCDLVTGMVGEFPELQGVMGGHYARVQGEPEAVCRAIAEHYAPKGPDDCCPTAPESVVVALADKLDTLAGFFGAGLRPSGAKDPFALRRAALGVIRLVLTNGLRLPLREVLGQALAGYGDRFPATEHAQIVQVLLPHVTDRLGQQLVAETGAGAASHSYVRAVLGTGDDDLSRIRRRVLALASFLATADGQNLLTGYRRASNIVAIEEKKDGQPVEGQVVADLLQEPVERTLAGGLDEAEGRIAAALDAEDFTAAMAALASMRGPVDAFFESVMVNVPQRDTRANRLRLLGRIRAALSRVADFGLIEDSGREA
ncbi:MAG: glycine--tRNA ligase subunit beta [Geminicoccaceae bacterium]